MNKNSPKLGGFDRTDTSLLMLGGLTFVITIYEQHPHVILCPSTPEHYKNHIYTRIYSLPSCDFHVSLSPCTYLRTIYVSIRTGVSPGVTVPQDIFSLFRSVAIHTFKISSGSKFIKEKEYIYIYHMSYRFSW